MWYKLNQSIGVALLIAIVGGGGGYGLYKFFTAPPLLRQDGDPEIDPRQHPYSRDAMAEFDRRMNEIQRQQAAAFQEAIDVRNSALSQ
jgi:hypothetical protein